MIYILSFIALVTAFISFYYWGFFLINDVTTTPRNPPQYHQLALLAAEEHRDMKYTPQSQSLQEKFYPDLQPLVVDIPRESAFKKVIQMAETLSDWKLISIDETLSILEAVVTTKFMHFQDDVVIEIRLESKANKDGESREVSVIHMRSKSRVGKGDFGVNARRIKMFFAKLE